MTPGITARQYLLQVNLIYGAQIFTLIVFGTIAFSIRPATDPDPEFSTILHYVLAALLVTSLFGAHFVFRLLVEGVEQTMPLKSKLQKFLSAIIVRAAFLEVSGLFAGIVIILSGSLLPLAVLTLVLILFYIFRPTISQIAQELKLTGGERSLIENPETILE